VPFYTMESHTQIDPAAPLIVDDAIASARANEDKRRSGLAAHTGVEGGAQ
jgi:hypothetical protein